MFDQALSGQLVRAIVFKLYHWKGFCVVKIRVYKPGLLLSMTCSLQVVGLCGKFPLQLITLTASEMVF